MTVLFITHYYAMYGANKSLLQLMLELRRDYGVQPIVLLRNKGELSEALEKEGIPYIVSHYYWWVNQDKGLFLKILNIRKQILNRLKIKKILQQLEPYKIDLVYSNSVCVNIGYYLKKRLQTPHIWHIRESLESYRFKLSLGKVYSKYFFKKAADRYILISDYLCEFYNDFLPMEKTIRIYNGIDFSDTETRTNKQGEYLNLCMVGIISEQKNQLEGIEAIKIIRDIYHREKNRLHLIGGHKSEYLALIKDFIRQNGLEEHVVFHGHQGNIHTLLREMNIKP